MRSLRLTFVLTLTAASGWASAGEERPALQALPAGAQQLVTTWLALDCGAPNPLTEEMARGRGALEASLWEAYELGPGASERAALQASLVQAWAARRAWIQRDGPRSLGVEAAGQLAAVTEEDYRSSQVRRLETRYRDAALAGLGLACTERSRPRLESIASDDTNPSQQAAREALRRSGGCSTRPPR
jgi:hypothetical protein